MSRQSEIDKIEEIIAHGLGHSCTTDEIARVLVDNGIGTKDRFEVFLDLEEDEPVIEPIDYKDAK